VDVRSDNPADTRNKPYLIREALVGDQREEWSFPPMVQLRDFDQDILLSQDDKKHLPHRKM
jgi:hypothetical protein